MDNVQLTFTGQKQLIKNQTKLKLLYGQSIWKYEKPLVELSLVVISYLTNATMKLGQSVYVWTWFHIIFIDWLFSNKLEQITHEFKMKLFTIHYTVAKWKYLLT